MSFLNGWHTRHEACGKRSHGHVSGVEATESSVLENAGGNGAYNNRTGGSGRTFRGRLRRALKAFACGTAAFATLFAGAIVPAYADGSAALSLTKTVQGISGADPQALKPGDQFQYVMSLQCQQSACVNVKLEDKLPNGLNGFSIEGFDVALGSGATTYTATVDWKQGGNDLHGTKPTRVNTDTSVTITPTYGLDGGKVGMDAGSTGTVTLGLRVPGNFTADNPVNGKTVTNTAKATADDADSVTRTASVRVQAPVDLKASATAAFTPTGGEYATGRNVGLALGAKNESTLRVDKFTMQEPQASASAAGAASLADDNPFRIFDLDTLPTSSAADALPGATAVEVDAYVKSDDQWVWTQGTADANFALPNGMNKTEVAGLRFIFTGDMAAGASASLDLGLKMRATDRNDSNVRLDDIAHSITVDGTEDVTVSKGNVTSSVAKAPASASTKFMLTAAKLEVAVNQAFSPNPSPAGNNTKATITAENTGAAVKRLEVSTAKDKDGNASDIFNADVTFGGFSGAVDYPAGADRGKIVYHLLTGGDQSAQFANGARPASPTGNAKIKSFDAVFWTSNGQNLITPTAAVTLEYNVHTKGHDSGINFDSTGKHDFAANVVAKVTAANNTEATAGSAGKLTLTKPKTHVSVGKDVRPKGSARPGQTVIAQLHSSFGSDNAYIRPNKLTVEDSWSLKSANADTGAITTASSKEADGFWNGFNLTSIRATQIPANVGVTVSVLTSAGWKTIITNAARSTSYFLEKNNGDFATALAGVSSSVEDVTGIRFVFTAGSGTTFNDQNVMSQYLGFTARQKLRSDSTKETDKADDGKQNATGYFGTAAGQKGNVTAVAEGEADDTTAVKSADESGASGAIMVYPQTAPPSDPVHLPDEVPTNPIVNENGWIQLDFTHTRVSGLGHYEDFGGSMDSIAAQSGDATTAHARWSVNDGMKQATVTVKNDASWSEDFNLLLIPGISTVNASAYTNAWCLKYDTITKVELYSDSDWHEVSAPGGSWQETDGSFKGMDYTDIGANPLANVVAAPNVDETLPGKADTYKNTGFRITVVPNDTARTNARADHTDMFAPLPGSGVVSTCAFIRDFPSIWQLRNKKRGKAGSRDLSDFVTGHAKSEEQSGGDITSVPLTDSIKAYATVPVTSSTHVHYAVGEGKMTIYNYDPSISLSTPADKDIVIPPYGTGGTYPSRAYSYIAKNTSQAQASYVRVTLPSECKASGGTCYMDDPTPANAEGDPFARYVGLDTGKLDQGSDLPNIFNRQNLTKIQVLARYLSWNQHFAQGDPLENHVSFDDSVVWLLHYDDSQPMSNRFSTTKTNVTAATQMSVEELKDVVGVSVTFRGKNPEVTGGTIPHDLSLEVVASTQVRSTLRDTGEPFAPDKDAPQKLEKKNGFTAQTYDPVLASDKKAGSREFGTVTYTAGDVRTKATETITPQAVTEVNPAEQTVTFSGASVDAYADPHRATLSPTKVTITSQPDGQGFTDEANTEHKTSRFWANLDFRGLDEVTFPLGATRVKIGVYGPFGTGGAMAWKDGDWQAKQSVATPSYDLPIDTTQYGDVQGIRASFDNTVGGQVKLFSSSGASWNASVKYRVKLRKKVRGSNAKVTFPGNATNIVTSYVESTTMYANGRRHEAMAQADPSWSAGDVKLGLSEFVGNGYGSIHSGKMVPWDIFISNKGVGYLDLEDVVDELPTNLRFTGEGGDDRTEAPVVFTPGVVSSSPGSAMLTTAPSVDSSNPDKVVFTWPEGKNRMYPGEVAQIRIWLELKAGSPIGIPVKNPVKADTVEELVGAEAENGSAYGGYGDLFDAFTNNHGARVYAHTVPLSGQNVYVVQAVAGARTGAVNQRDSALACTPLLDGLDGKKYYRAPCAANTAIGGKDHWVMRAFNAGNTTLDRIQYFEDLPTVGDKYVATNDSRESMYRPELTEAPKVVGAPAGTGAIIEASTAAHPCQGTWNGLPGQASPGSNDACTAATDWTLSGSVADWSKVTALRVTLDFTTSTTGYLDSGKGVDITYVSRNVPKTESGTHAYGASLDTTAGQQRAWAQFGLIFNPTSGPAESITPRRVGTRVDTGSVSVAKRVAGPKASAKAPQRITGKVTCRDADGESITFDGSGAKAVTLNKTSGLHYDTARVSGIPLSIGNGTNMGKTTSCVVSEDGPVGKFQEDSRSTSVDGDSTNTAKVAQADSFGAGGDVTNEVAAAQGFVMTNTYNAPADPGSSDPGTSDPGPDHNNPHTPQPPTHDSSQPQKDPVQSPNGAAPQAAKPKLVKTGAGVAYVAIASIAAAALALAVLIACHRSSRHVEVRHRML
ncbi:hypothetical protein [Bifidobacterium sp. ESL0732]|uniref:hypothetical protein n=1 Tax=Bifidobacterium sp. ESL0732 TaxID=2983222 RepID=UPI0023F98623|nr:hypothetical protein [Bifidobacterium sp. ESL0732]WEV63966.1 hypothetical protein OZX70_08620 [Bifidobacterium sp. ESL0732]